MTLNVIRGFLGSGQLYPLSVRYDPSTDEIQRTLDGGATWVASPADDPRHSLTFQLPPRTGSAIPCDAAANMVDKLKGYVDTVIAAGELWAAVTFVVRNIAPFFVEVGLVADIIATAIDALLTIGVSALSATMTTGVYTGIQNILYCEVEPDGTITADGVAAARTLIEDSYGSTVLSIFDYLMLGLGEVGLTNAGATGSVTGDCSGAVCEWIHTFDFTVNNGGWGVYTAGHGNWVTAFGWGVTGANTCDISAGLFARNIDRIKVKFTCTNQDGSRPSVILYHTASQVARIDTTKAAGSNSSHETWTYTFAGELTDLIRVAIIGNNAVTWLESVEVKGHGGDDPF